MTLKRVGIGEPQSRVTVAKATKLSSDLHHAGKTHAWFIGFVLGLAVTMLSGSALLRMRHGQLYIEEASIAEINNTIRPGRTTARIWCALTLRKPEPIKAASTAFLTKEGAAITFFGRSLSSRCYVSPNPKSSSRTTALHPEPPRH